MSEPDLTDLERRLNGWRPTSDGLDTDAMLFAAGRASVRRSPARFAWPTIAACLAMAVGLLGNRLLTERAENRQLFARLQQSEVAAKSIERPPELSNTSYLVARRALERDPDGWQAQETTHDDAPIREPVLRAGQRDIELNR